MSLRSDLSREQALMLVEYIDELEALIEEDDGTFFTSPFLDKHNEVKELCYAIGEGK